MCNNRNFAYVHRAHSVAIEFVLSMLSMLFSYGNHSSLRGNNLDDLLLKWIVYHSLVSMESGAFVVAFVEWKRFFFLLQNSRPHTPPDTRKCNHLNSNGKVFAFRLNRPRVCLFSVWMCVWALCWWICVYLYNTHSALLKRFFFFVSIYLAESARKCSMCRTTTATHSNSNTHERSRGHIIWICKSKSKSKSNCNWRTESKETMKTNATHQRRR